MEFGPRERCGQRLHFAATKGFINTKHFHGKDVMKRKTLICGLVILAAVIAWAAFRPDRLFINAKVNEGLPAEMATQASESVVASGTFHEVAHKTVGNATIYQFAGGRRILRFANFETSNGPDVRVYLVAARDASDNETVEKAGFVETAALKGNIGDQNYELASNLDLNKYRAVTIWCKRFSVNFATAALSLPHPLRDQPHPPHLHRRPDLCHDGLA